MGLTGRSVGRGAIDSGLEIKKKSPDDVVVALAGNPNVGKSTVFNALTGMNQHTGNWPGKTVANAQGRCESRENSYIFVDIPGTYSLMAHSSEEEVARNFLCFGSPDVIAIVCDATCLERNLNLVLQTLEISSNVVLCVNLLDEAKRKRIKIDLELLSERLGISVVGIVARKKKTLSALLSALDETVKSKPNGAFCVKYCEEIEHAAGIVAEALPQNAEDPKYARQLALKLLDSDESLLSEIKARFGGELLSDEKLISALNTAEEYLLEQGFDKNRFRDSLVSSLVRSAEQICDGVVIAEDGQYGKRDLRIDRILTGKYTAYPFMIILLAFIFWLTISGANYPSELLSRLLFSFQDGIYEFLVFTGAPTWLCECLVFGVYRVLAWVVSVMLPPMAIFFPLFTLLEDVGYLPRVAYNLDKPFRSCNACGKQALTMCMGFGCNAAGVVGCRIIDSPRERLLAILTNSFVPCNGRFPALIAVLTIFFIGSGGGALSSVASAALLTLVILLGIFATFIVTRLLSETLLRGIPSSFTLEMPPFRRPQVAKVIVRSVLDRTLFVLGRAVAFSAPAGLLIWVFANVYVGDASLLAHAAAFLDPLAHLLGLDGVILLAFILGFPANEIVIPIIIMAYLSQGTLTEFQNLAQLKELFVANGWTVYTAVSFVLFSLFHWPCSTTLMTVKKETGSLKWTALAALIPAAVGALLCFMFSTVVKAFGLG